MGKAGRIACIFTPYAMTLVSLALLVIVELGGKSTGSSVLNDVYAWQADFTNLTIPSGDSTIGTLLETAESSGNLAKLYQIHLYNYCSGNTTGMTYCSTRDTGFVFDPITAWDLNDTSTTSSSSKAKRQSPVASPSGSTSDAANTIDTQIKAIFGTGVYDALKAYETASKWMGIAFQVALWTSVATALTALLAIFSRWGSLITWILSLASSIFSFAAALTASIVFGSLAATLKAVLDTYDVDITLGGRFFAYVWLSTLLSIGATSFWLFSVCCCSGKSNPHHKSNRGGLWRAEPKDGYAPARGTRVEQTGGYQRVSSPYLGAGADADRVPLRDYPAPAPTGGIGYHHAPAYEPYRPQG